MSYDLFQLLLVPTCFVLAGALGVRLGTPRSVAAGLLGVGAGHLAAFGCSTIALDSSGSAADWAHLASQVLFMGGFVALLWIATVFPQGGPPGAAVRGGAAAAVAFPLLAAVSGSTPTVVASDRELGPLIDLLPSEAASVAALPLLALPLATLVVFVVRLRRAGGETRRSMWWPVAGVAAVSLLVVMGIALGSTYPGAGDAAFLVAAPVVPLTVAFGPIRRQLVTLTRQTTQLGADLELRVAELEESRRRLAAATDEERRRIERDLHDGAQQQLLALIAHAELARASTDPEDRDAALDRVADLASGAYSTVRQVSQGVRPPMLEDLGLAAAIRGVAERLPITVRLELSEPDDRLDPEVESAALFFVTEALANVLKHAGASSVAVRMAVTSDGLHLEVEDDGSGGADPVGSGLRGLCDRVEAVGGSVVIDSGADGTRLAATIPGAGRG